MEPRSVQVSSRIYRRPRIQIIKRRGTSRLISRSHDEIRRVDIGALTITNHRLVFSGKMQAITVDFSTIIEIKAYRDGFALRHSTSQKTQYFVWSKKNPPLIEFTVEGRSYKEFFSGPFLKYFIESLQYEAVKTAGITKPTVSH
jgi:hypothetical protein